MRHHYYNPDFKFVVEPEHFNKYTERELLQYCLGATMYMPGYQDITEKILKHSMPGLTTIVLCFEDACPEERLEEAMENVHQLLNDVSDAVEKGTADEDIVPLIFVRIRDLAQFKAFGEKLTPKEVRSLCGINFPKFNAENGYEYFAYLKDLNDKFGEILYGMPIIEDPEVAYKESRIQQLIGIKKILDKYHDLVLQVRVGGTDFSSVFGVRRGVDYTLYDIMTVSECISDIINVCGRNNEYVISGPVWEYFRAPKEMMFEELPHHDIEDYLMRRQPLVNGEIDGLLREVILDKANGMVGRTVIHPTHVKFVNAMLAVTAEEYSDACQILETSGGVVKGAGGNKMNEIKPHTNWAKKVYNCARAFGVIKNESGYIKLFADN
ncbi:MAG: HpcH/HpaI aldolase/citrate lyase family protein [Clostridiales bacterium]|nr:HpcH/HpaI aldolase/citrate lyase family protein [Candidatus Crickella caballi]